MWPRSPHLLVAFLLSATACASAVFLLAFSPICAAQQAGATGAPLVIRATSLLKGYLRQPYDFRLHAEGGILPLKWKLSNGALPKGVSLSENGELNGVPTEAGQFHFAVTVNDSGKPAYQRSQEFDLQIVAPLLAVWSRIPRVIGSRVEGALKVSNQTENDFDLTVIILAVAENGRATALGHRHFTLARNTTNLEIAFGENLPRGTYEVNADAVAEVAETNVIYRARLVTEQLQVQQGP